jgi:hypothetical protein
MTNYDLPMVHHGAVPNLPSAQFPSDMPIRGGTVDHLVTGGNGREAFILLAGDSISNEPRNNS